MKRRIFFPPAERGFVVACIKTRFNSLLIIHYKSINSNTSFNYKSMLLHVSESMFSKWLRSLRHILSTTHMELSIIYPFEVDILRASLHCMKWHTTELNGKNKPNNLNSFFNTGALFYFLNWSPQLMSWCTWENMRIEGHISMRSEAAVVITRWSGAPGQCGDTRDMWQHLSSLLGSGYAAAAVPHNRHQYSFKRTLAKISQSRRRPLLLALATGSFNRSYI